MFVCFDCVCACSTRRSQKRASDLLELEFQAVGNCGPWVPSSERDPLQEPKVLLIAEPSLQP